MIYDCVLHTYILYIHRLDKSLLLLLQLLSVKKDKGEVMILLLLLLLLLPLFWWIPTIPAVVLMIILVCDYVFCHILQKTLLFDHCHCHRCYQRFLDPFLDECIMFLLLVLAVMMIVVGNLVILSQKNLLLCQLFIFIFTWKGIILLRFTAAAAIFIIIADC